MKKLLGLIVSMSLLSAYAQNIIPVRNANVETYDYIDTITKKIISKYSYDQASPFSEGMALVNRNGLFGFINTSGEEVIQCKYIHANDFSEGLASVSIGIQEITESTIWIKDEKYGAIDKKGQKIIPFKFREIARFKNGIARASDLTTQNWGWIDTIGVWNIDPQFRSGEDFNELGMAKVSVIKKSNNDSFDAYGYINKKGKFVILPIYYQLSAIEAGIALAKTIGGKYFSDGNYGFINQVGETIVPFKYDVAEMYSGNLALVGKKNNLGEMRYGFIDKSGFEQISLQFEYAHSFLNELAFVKQNRRFGWINNTGKYVIPNVYDMAEDFRFPEDERNGWIDPEAGQRKYNSAIVSKDSFWGVLDISGKEILPVIYDSMVKSRNGFTTKKNESKMFFDLSGKKTNSLGLNYQPGYAPYRRNADTFLSVNRFKNIPRGRNLIGEFISDYSKLGVIKVSSSGKKYGIIYDNGKFFSKFDYDSIKTIAADLDINCGLVGYKKGKLYILTASNLPYGNTDTAIINSTDYSLIENYNEFSLDASNLIRVKKGDGYGVIYIKDEKIQELVKPIFQDIGMLPCFSYKKNNYGLVPVKQNGVWGFVDPVSGQIKIPCQYQNVGGFNDRDESGFCQVKKNNKWGIINEKGVPISPIMYDDALCYAHGLCAVKKDGKWGFINEFGSEVTPCLFNWVTIHYEWESLVKLNKMEIVIDEHGNWIY
jgi:WG containing repeat